jgi:hypothetical protein
MTDGGTCKSGTSRIVVSLCDHSGNMVRPWATAGYDCYAVDLKNDDTTKQVGDGQVHYVEADVREWEPPERPVRIGFGFPPCTDLAVSGARWFQDKGLSALAEAIELVGACQETLADLGCPWMIENPKSTLSTHWRSPDYKFDPFEYDGYTGRNERYTKETWLWTGGGFKMPRTVGVREHQADDRIHKMPPSEERSEKRSETPTGFARAVFLAHEQDGYAQPGTGTQQETLVTSTDGGNTREVQADTQQEGQDDG